MKKLIIFAPVQEFNVFGRMNCFLWKIKPQFEKIIVVTYPQIFGVFNQADEFISVKDSFLDKHGINYPEILETPSRIVDIFIERIEGYISENYDLSKHLILYNHIWSIKDKEGNVYFDWYSVGGGGVALGYKRDCNIMREYLRSGGKLLMPTQKDYDSIKSKYGHLFNDNTFILITRNFKNKQPFYNASVTMPNLTKLIEHLINAGIKIINIGTPPAKFNIASNNYFEITNYNLSYGEWLALFCLAKGVMLSVIAGGYLVHLLANNDLFILDGEWTVLNPDINISVIEARHERKDVSTIDFSGYLREAKYKEIADVLTNHRKVSNISFSDEKITQFV